MFLLCWEILIALEKKTYDRRSLICLFTHQIIIEHFLCAGHLDGSDDAIVEKLPPWSSIEWFLGFLHKPLEVHVLS